MIQNGYQGFPKHLLLNGHVGTDKERSGGWVASKQLFIENVRQVRLAC